MKHTAALVAAALLAACSSFDSQVPTMRVPTRPFGITDKGAPATLYMLKNGELEVDVMDYGATIVSIKAPDRLHQSTDITLGFDDVSGYQSDANMYFGCTVGRVCNRIAKGTFTLDGYTYHLAVNNGPNALHGGVKNSFDKVMWHATAHVVDGVPTAVFTYKSGDGEEGYPGNLAVKVTFRLPSSHELRIDYEATTDMATPVNLTNHTYWNFAGQGSPTILDHEVLIDADEFTPADDTLIPTGEIKKVALTPFDFRFQAPIGQRIDAVPGGYDLNYVLRGGTSQDLHPAATVYHPGSGRLLEILTTEPGVQLYSGNFLHGQKGKGGKTYAQHSGLCLETQHYPDSVNHPNFPSTILRPGETFRSTTLYRFSIR
jgi:aldose 1-epimerase